MQNPYRCDTHLTSPVKCNTELRDIDIILEEVYLCSLKLAWIQHCTNGRHQKEDSPTVTFGSTVLVENMFLHAVLVATCLAIIVINPLRMCESCSNTVNLENFVVKIFS